MIKSFNEIWLLLKKKYAVFIVLIVISTLLILTLFTNLFQSHKQQISKELQIAVATVERTLEDKIASTESIAKSMNLQIAANSDNKRHILQILQKFRSTPELNDSFSWTIFSWSNADFFLTVDAEYGIMSQPFDLKIRDYISLTKSEPARLHLGLPVIGSTSKKWMIPGGVGNVAEKNGKYLGAVVIGFEIDALARSLRQAIKNDLIEIRLFDKNGDSLLTSRVDFVSSNKDLEDEKGFVLAMLKKAEAQSLPDINLGKARARLAFRANSLPYLIVVSYNKDGLSQKLWKEFYFRSLEILAMMVATIALLIFVYKTESKQYEKLMEAKKSEQSANQAKSRLIYSISHDIRNYIFGIGGLAGMILSDQKTKKTLKDEDFEMLEEVKNQTEELGYFVEDLLDSKQNSSGHFNLGSLIQADLAQLIKKVLTLNARFIADNEVLVKTEIASNLPTLRCDPRRMKQILNNLISNAVKYSKKGGEVLISAHHLEEQNQIYLEILDHGFGMNEEEVVKYLAGDGEKIDKSEILQTKKVDSYGIGMSIVLRLIELHHGKIEVESKKGVGTKVKIYFGI